MHPIDLILTKREGRELSSAQIDGFIHAVLSKEITDAQLGSLLMAIYQRGLTPAELAALTRAMRFSGEVFNTRPLHEATPAFTVDKHSTGGVGDKPSLLIAPIVAAAGLEKNPGIFVPMISGRSLGHTGGTLDKLETIPGFNTQLSSERMMQVLRDCRAVLMGQTPHLVPADRILYAMRDHTGTVESPDLITASIMSKKLAEDLDGLVLDVKVGSGAFMPNYAASRHLAELMVATGEASGTRTVALLTSMDEPLGRFSGNWLEVWECIDILQNKPHPRSADVIELSLTLSGWMLHLAGKSPTPEAGHSLAAQILRSGAAYKSWLQIVAAQGGDTSIFADPAAFHQAAFRIQVLAASSGYLTSMDCKQVGWAVQRLGAGRTTPGGPVNAHAGLESHARLGDRIQQGQPLFTLFADDESLLAEPHAMITAALQLGDTRPPTQPLIREIVRNTTETPSIRHP